jgi:hypothetical protein
LIPAGPESDFLSRVPAGGLLAALARLLLSADRCEEFLGDLVEEGTLRLRVGSPRDVALWMWSQLLRSAPSLVGCRLRRLAARALPLGGGLLVGPRGGHRGWPLSLAVSVSAHGLVLVGAAALVLSRVEEIGPRFMLELPGEMTDPPVEAEALAQETAVVGFGDALPVQARARRSKAVRRPLPPPVETAAVAPAGAFPSPSPVESEAPTAPGVAAAMGAPRGLAASPVPTFAPLPPQPRALPLPPKVGEKRCLICPTPQIPHPYSRLGIGQEVVVNSCVTVKGRVSSVQVVRGIDPVINAKVVETVRGWRLLPYSVDGHLVPFCYVTRFLFTTH